MGGAAGGQGDLLGKLLLDSGAEPVEPDEDAGQEVKFFEDDAGVEDLPLLPLDGGHEPEPQDAGQDAAEPPEPRTCAECVDDDGCPTLPFCVWHMPDVGMRCLPDGAAVCSIEYPGTYDINGVCTPKPPPGPGTCEIWQLMNPE